MVIILRRSWNILSRDTVFSSMVFLYVVPDLRVLKIFESRSSNQQATGDILYKLHGMLEIGGKMVLCHVGQHRIGNGDATMRGEVDTGSPGQRLECINIDDQVCYLFSDMRHVLNTVVFSHGGRRAKHGLHRGNPVTGSGMPVQAGKVIYQRHGELPLAAKEHPVPGHKDIIKYNE